MRTTECSWRLCPSPGIYAVTSIPFVRRTRATLRNAEFGFFGVWVRTVVHTPRFCGEPLPYVVRWVKAFRVKRSAGDLLFLLRVSRPLRTNWLIVGIVPPSQHQDTDRDYNTRPPSCQAHPKCRQPTGK